MPRPKVLPSERQRASEACNSCREAKKRCSGVAPCTHCLRRGIGDSCFVSHRPRGQRASISASSSSLPSNTTLTPRSAAPPTRGRPQPSANSQGLGALSSPVQNTTPTRTLDLGSTASSQFRPTSNDSARTSTADQSQTLSTADGSDAFSATKSSSRMLLNLRGERVYFGGGGSLSFLQLVRSIVTDQIGPSQFSRSGKSDTMLEKESPYSQVPSPNLSDLSLEARLMCADYYYAVTGGFLDLFLPQELEGLLTSPEKSTRQQRSLRDLVVAIGLQCQPSTDTHDREMAYFRESQTHAFSNMLEDPDIDMVRSFLVMSFYLLGECRRNTAFLYLGIAARAAVALGLHSKDTYADMNDPKHQLRLRVWMSLRVLDIVVNTLLGRPAATTGIHSDVQSLVDDIVSSSQDRGLICLGAAYRLVAIMNDVVHKMYDRKEISVPAIEAHLQQLEQWSQSLPDFLRTPPTSESPDSSSEKGAIGRVHVSCVYYFAVTLVTRPILVSTLTQQSAGGLVHSQLAAACLDAASFVIQTCSGARKVSLLQANMAILKAIIFPAGLVLGFEIFAKGTVDYGIESAFHGSRELLKFLGVKSPQAALYHDILTSLSNAIAEYRQRAVTKGRSSYVSKIFNFDRNQSDGPDTEMGQPTSGSSAPVIEPRTQMDDILASWSLGTNTPVDSSEMFLDWDSLDISQWGSFPYVA